MNRSSPGLLISKSIDGFLKFKAAEGLSQRTITSYEYTLNHWLYQIGDRDVSEIDASDLTNYLAWLRTEYKPVRFKMIRAETLSFGSRGIPPFLSVQLSYARRP
jgi:integrase/recombinase XerD